ncbi:RNA-binding transcriptional accessory protein [Corynebacterium pseudodiphtheriticum]|uniref:Tex family protein n=1 Tax=Corynebacterium pseudodiphtheriticum TaxID=37637 RepID=UPI00223B47A7|nr:Tex family protein [Corynebacterium pseudodiphtheriticum]MCT1634727.1 RNA-binding transcriptional accessory protein [Corynebacterium pseudodiphtheriticum]MCT1665822.1 RNA-binding transcriptional accessory protein [Corynebacterium pseudodiphtheriticum]WKS30312.1 RNA-binding transcriptional accessory protein [Corynebacterium pseudodiphtheriticum]WKS51914.1 RNA-binding transcriptional accessory protein [Corynebacterium pseudodiphtheriticum]
MIASVIAEELGVSSNRVQAALSLLAEGNTVPFIARYRKEATGALDDTQLRHIQQRADYLEELAARKETILAAIDEQGKLTDKLRAEISECDSKARLEDLYLPYKKRRKTKADKAREAGLEPLTDTLIENPSVDPETAAQDYLVDGYADAKAALDGARAILVDRLALDADLVGEVREQFFRDGTLGAQVVAGKETEGAKFRDYFDFSEPLTALPSHRILALLRAESEGIIQLEFDGGDDAGYEHLIAQRFELDTAASSWLAQAVRWGWRTKLMVSAGLDARNRLRSYAEDEALQVFSTNLRDVLLAAPAGQKAMLGMDPGYRNGVKCAVVDATGKVVDTTVVYPHQPQKQWAQAVEVLRGLCAKHAVELVAVGNGTASRESEELAAEVVGTLETRPQVVVVSESGASVYSASAQAAAELPDMDVSLRGAVSIARRLQDPLAELVKIDPKSIGVGQYQHDVNQTNLARALDDVVEDAVNSVGVDVNTASVPLLERVAGLNSTVAENLVTYRHQNGRFATRKELVEVPRLGPKAFEQAAGFLRINGGDNPLDSSAVHPEAYPVVQKIAAAVGAGVEELIGDSARLAKLQPAEFADEEFGELTIADIIAELEKPGRDPRPEFRTASFKEGVTKVADLQPGMILEGTVTNVAAFGAFIDVGVHQDGLVHISAMSNKFVSDPHTVVRSGEIVKVKVIDVDVDRQRIGLSLRLDDEPGAGSNKSGGNKPGGGSSRKSSNQGGRSGRSGGDRAETRAGKGRGTKNSAATAKNKPAGSMADALRNAGFGA